ncbi:uncharacterized protein GJ701_000448 isoform 1-T1 [Geothlypis trichas]
MRRHLGFPGNRCRGGRGSRESPGFPARLRAAAGPGRASPPGWARPGRPPLPRGVPGPAPPPLAGAARGPGEQRPRPQRKVSTVVTGGRENVVFTFNNLSMGEVLFLVSSIPSSH